MNLSRVLKLSNYLTDGPVRCAQAQAALDAHQSLVAGKLAALQKYCARLEAAHAWAAPARDKAVSVDSLPPEQRQQALRDIQVTARPSLGDGYLPLHYLR